MKHLYQLTAWLHLSFLLIGLTMATQCPSPSVLCVATGCRAACSSCDFNDPNFCATCTDTSLIATNGDCVLNSGTGPCINPCARCTVAGGSSCTACYTGFSLSGGVCTPTGVLTPSTQYCTNTNCATCYEFNRGLCLSCYSGNSLSPAYDCIPTSGSGTPPVTPPVTNGATPSGLVTTSGCQSRCASCDPNDLNYCATCPGAAVPYEGDCVPPLVGAEVRTCNHKECAACLPSDLNACTECFTGYTLSGGVCTPNGGYNSASIRSSAYCLNNNCQSCYQYNRNLCLNCYSGAGRFFGDCAICSGKCRTCVDNEPSTCASCWSGTPPTCS